MWVCVLFFPFRYPPFQALIFKLLSKWNSKIHLLSFIPSCDMFCLHIHTSFGFHSMRMQILFVCYAYRSSYGATHIHYLFPDSVHFYFNTNSHTNGKKRAHAKQWLPNTQTLFGVNERVLYGNNLCLATHTIFICFEWWKWTFIGWIEWVGIFIFESTPFTNIEFAVGFGVSE